MKWLTLPRLVVGALCWCAVSIVWNREAASESPPGSGIASPYFMVADASVDLSQFPLLTTDADVRIEGSLAEVTVVQTYQNQLDRPLEAIYVFPASTKAAVHRMEMKIGERTIAAKIQERQTARNTFEAAKANGQVTALLEQHRTNVLQMNVANILPGERVLVTLSYSEQIVPREGLYQFVYPAVVGPRYVSSGEPAGEQAPSWNANPYLPEGSKAPAGFAIKASISSGIPLKELRSKSHQVEVNYRSESQAQVGLLPTDGHDGNRDFVLEYRLASGKIESGILLDRGTDENFFLLTLEPPKRVSEAQIPPREYIFVVDVSGSMHGFPLAVTKTLMRDLLSALRPTDIFNIILFAGNSSQLAPSSQPVTAESISQAQQLVDKQQGAGGTELLPALERALNLPTSSDFARSVIVVTDGYVSVEREAFALIKQKRNVASVYAFGIGSSVNRYLIEGMAHAGGGEPFVVLAESEAAEAVERFVRYVSSPVLSHIEVSFDGFGAYDLVPSSIPDLLANRPLTIAGKWKGEPRGRITVRGTSADGEFTLTQDVGAGDGMSHSALRTLWARQAIAELADYASLGEHNANRSLVVELGLKYGILTDFTLFVAVDSERRVTPGALISQRQPLPLPQGVSNYAVGGGSFSEASFDDSFVRTNVGNLISLIGGTPGRLVLVGSAALAVLLLLVGCRSKRRRIRFVGMASLCFSLAVFGLRSVVDLLFGSV